MIAKPRSIALVGFVQTLLAASFVVWLLFFPQTATQFAWPIAPIYSAMFMGAGFIVRTYIGIKLWREKNWDQLRWQALGNYAFLAVIFLATFWHIEAMNWTSNIWMAHIWVLAYIIEPVTLPLMEPRSARPYVFPPTMLRGPVMSGLKRVCLVGLVVCVTIGGLAFINPAFLNTRWPWELDPFDARIMSSFLALCAVWCLQVYQAEDWGVVRENVFGLALFAVAQSAVWLVNLSSFDPERENTIIYGVVLISFSVLLIYYAVSHELANRKARTGLPQSIT